MAPAAASTGPAREESGESGLSNRVETTQESEPSHGVTFSAGLVAREGRRDELVKTFQALLGSIRGSAGCLQCNLLEDVQQSNEIKLLVQWESREDFERHVKSDAFRRVLVGMELSAEPPDLRIQTIAGVSGMDLLREILECDDRAQGRKETVPEQERLPKGETR